MRFCPTVDLDPARPVLGRHADRRRRHAAARRHRAVPDDRARARLPGDEGDLPGAHARGRRRRDLPLQRQLLRAPGLRRRHALGARVRPLLRRAGVAHRRLRARLDAHRRPALREPRRAAPARPARRPGDRAPGRPRRQRRVGRRRARRRPRLPQGPHPPARRQLHALVQPARHAAAHRRRVPALGLVRPHDGAGAERPARDARAARSASPSAPGSTCSTRAAPPPASSPRPAPTRRPT